MLSSIIFEDYSPLGRVFYQPTAQMGYMGWQFPAGRLVNSTTVLGGLTFAHMSTLLLRDTLSPHRAAHVSHVRCSVLPECRLGVTPDTRLRRQLQFKDVLLTRDTNWKLWRKFIGGNYLLPKSQSSTPE